MPQPIHTSAATVPSAPPAPPSGNVAPRRLLSASARLRLARIYLGGVALCSISVGTYAALDFGQRNEKDFQRALKDIYDQTKRPRYASDPLWSVAEFSIGLPVNFLFGGAIGALWGTVWPLCVPICAAYALRREASRWQRAPPPPQADPAATPVRSASRMVDN